MNLSNSIISLSFGRYALSDCFIADTKIFSMRSVLMTFRSEKRQQRKESWSIPISVAFSANHSFRSMFLVGAIAIWIRQGRRGGCGMDSFTVTRQRLWVAADISAL